MINKQDVITVIKDADVFVSYDAETDIDDVIEITIANTKNSAIESIKELPSADAPDTNVGDTISRRGFLRAFEEMCSCTDYVWDERDFRDLIKKMPSAEPRKKGKWTWFAPNGFKCSECERYLKIASGNVKMNFCPNCGADMTEGESKK